MRKIRIVTFPLLIFFLIALEIFSGFVLRIQEAQAAISYVGSVSSTGNDPTSDSFSLPSGWQAGDVAVFWWFTYAETKTFTKPSGVTTKWHLGFIDYGKIYIGYRVLQNGDSTFGWTASSVANSTTIWGTSVFRGVDTSGDPFEAESGSPATFTNAINPNPPAVTTLTNNAWVIPIFCKRNDYTSITPPTNYTSAGSNSSTAGSDASAGVAYREIASPTTEDPGAWTLGGGLATDDGYVWTGALKPQVPTITVAPSVPQPPNVATPSTDNVLGVASIVKNIGTGSVTAVTIKENGGTIDATNELENVELWLSSDKTWDGGDTQLDTAKNFTGGVDGTCTFNPSFDVTTTTKYLIVRLDVKSGITPDKTIKIQIQDITTSDQKSGLPCDLSGTTTVTANWWNASWSYRKKLTFNNSAQSENLTNFPVLVKLSTSNFTYADAKSDGTDLRFIDSDNTTELKYHIEKWDPSGDSFIWVKVPQIDGSSNIDYVYMYYGYADAPDVQDEPNTFSNNYAAVWHMDEASWNGTAGEVKDSTLNGNNGTRVGDATTTTAGQVNGCGTFDGNGDYVEVADSASLDVTNLTINAWVNSTDFTPSDFLNSYNRIIVSKTDSKVGYQLGLTNENKPYFAFEDISVNNVSKYNNAFFTDRIDTGQSSTDGRVPMGSATRGDSTRVLSPFVIKDGSTYKMWYAGSDDTNIYRAYHATSTDGLVWTKYNNEIPANSDGSSTNGRIPLGNAGKGDDAYATFPTVIKDGSTYKMWYSGYDGANYCIYYATSTNGLEWTKYYNTIPSTSNTTSTNGRIPRGSDGKGDDAHAYHPTVIKDGLTYKMWYCGHDGTNGRIYYATSPDGLAWTKCDNSIPDPSNGSSTNGRIPLGTTGRGDVTHAINPAVIKDGSTYKMWYTGTDASSVVRIYYATSPDGLTWTKYDNTIPSPSNTTSTNGRIPLGISGSADDYSISTPRAIKDGSTYKIWYYADNGSIGPTICVYYATLETGVTRSTAVPSEFTMLSGVADTTADTIKLYVNGALNTSGTTSVNGVNNSEKLRIGELLNGKIDEVRISTVTRSADWIAAQYLSMTCQFTSFPPPTVTLGDGTDPSSSTVAPGSTNNYLDQFTFVIDRGTDSVTGLTVTSVNTSAIASMQIWNEAMATQYFSTVSSPVGDNWNFTGGTPIPVSTTTASFRVIFNAKGHASLAAGTYAVTGTVTSYTCTNSKTGTDTDSATITVDNSPPSDATWGTITPGNMQIELNWTNPGTDFYRVLILRKAGSAVADAPTEGTEYNVNDTIGGSTVTYVGSGTNSTDTGLTNGTSYYYKIFAYDTYINYAAGVSTGPHIPDGTPPAAITDLTGLCDSGTGYVTLSWSTPGDDGWNNTLPDGSRYIIDYSTYSIAWSTTTYDVEIPTHSVTPYTQVSHKITGLTGDTTWYFQIWTRDEIPTNWSGLSNGATVWVNSILSVSISTDTYDFGQVPLAQSTHTVSIIAVTNEGNVKETYSLKISSVVLSNGNPSLWEVGIDTDTAPANDKFLFYSIFHGTNVALNYFKPNDITTETNQISTSERFTHEEDGSYKQTGENVPLGEERKLWFRLDMPTGVTTAKEEKITITISAEKSP